MLRKFIAKVVDEIDLSEAESGEAMALIMGGEAPPTQIASFLTALRMKGETVQEITGSARAMRAGAVRIRAKEGEEVADTCGTGGDGKGTFNISTAVAFVAAGGECTVAKHLNRSVSSQCGSADVLEALGISFDLPPERVEKSLQEIGLAFLFAPTFHPATRHAAVPRREIGIRTIFNLLGPLTNPAGATIHLAGLYREDLLQPVAEVLRNLGSKSAFVVHSEDHCDEISITGKTTVCQLKNGSIATYQIEPERVGLKRAKLEEIQGGAPEKNAEILLQVLRGKPGPPRDVVLFNAAAVFVAAEKVPNLQEGVAWAGKSIDSGRAMRKFEEIMRFSKYEV
ncbi:MAG: anthranilate phosphoribosyltransferase [Deltaproteobacteria bacterium]|nr:MAG: anthranilate phosphoribosyltransferase [Deltaproteobacteria bacterium]